MSIIQFSHANGFPAKTYSVLFEQLKDHRISAIDILAENVRPEDICWYDLKDDILESAGQFGEPVIGVGHSFGGILTLLAAAEIPELFQTVILLDPPLFSLQKRGLIRLLRALNIEDWVSPSGKSKKRRSHFESKQQAHTLFQANKMFNNLHPQALNDYVTHGLTSAKNGVKLKISVEKEVAIFRNMMTSFPETVYKVRGTLVYAARNPILWPTDLRWIKRNFPELQVNPFPGSHLFPLENPEATARMIIRCIQSVKG